MYQYKMVQVPPSINVQEKSQVGNEAAVYLEGIVNEQAKEGWEFYRVDSIGVNVQPGCISALAGQKAAEATYYVVSFRKPA